MSQANPSVTRSLRSPLFLACAAVLSLSAVALRPGMAALAQHFRKQPIAPRRSLAEFDVSRLASFKVMTGASRFHVPGADIESAGTDELLLAALQDEDAFGSDKQVNLFVTYYSDPEDRVPHTPDVCYRQIGGVVTKMTTTTVATPGLAPEQPSVDVREVHVREAAGDVIVLFVLCANGEFCTDRQRVRLITGMSRARHVYFSKIEAVAPLAEHEDAEVAVQRCKRLLTEALPILVKEHFPGRDAFMGR
jgi:hypothetical protein